MLSMKTCKDCELYFEEYGIGVCHLDCDARFSVSEDSSGCPWFKEETNKED